MARKKIAPVVSTALVSDTGSSASDKITSNPAIKGTGQASTVVTIKEGGTTLGTTTADSTGAWSFTPSGLTDGAHTLTATQTDLAGNTGTATLSFTLDRTAPVVSTALVSDTGSSASDKITSNPAIKGTGQASTVVTIKEGGTTLGTTTADSTGAWSFTPSGLTDGAHTLTATQTDLAGNTGTATLSFTLDRTAPVVSTALVSDTGSSASDKITSNPAIKGTGQASTVVTIKEGGTTLGTTTADSTGAWSFTPSGLTDGAHTLTANQTDLAGNTGTATLSFTLDTAASTYAAGIQATTANSFLDSLGVNIHTAYSTYAVASTESHLQYLGFRYARDFASPATFPKLRQIHNDIGTKFDIYLPVGWGYGTSSAISAMQQNVDILDSVEGFNEPDNWPPSDTTVLGGQQQLYNAFHGIVPVYAWSLGNAATNSTKFGNATNYSDYSTAHTYPVSGNVPYDFIQQWDAYSQNWAAKPVVITEGGYSSYPNTTASVDETSQAKLTLNYVFDTYAQGAHKTYLYELNDETALYGATNRESNFGLFRDDGSPKPVANALHNLTTLLSDTTEFSTGSLDYSVSGLPATGHQLLLQKSDDTFVLTLWNDITPYWNSGASANSVNVTLSLGSPAQSVTVYDPLLSTQAVGSTGIYGGNISLPDHPILIFIDANG